MNISEGFIRRPIATSLLMAAITLFGAVAYRSLAIEIILFVLASVGSDTNVFYVGIGV